jgi:hypothetical protein
MMRRLTMDENLENEEALDTFRQEANTVIRNQAESKRHPWSCSLLLQEARTPNRCMHPTAKEEKKWWM